MSSLSITSYFPFARVKVMSQSVHDGGALIQVQPDRLMARNRSAAGDVGPDVAPTLPSRARVDPGAAR